jgi:hypothetical protein
LLDADQLSVGVVYWLAAPLTGDVSVTCQGKNAITVLSPALAG